MIAPAENKTCLSTTKKIKPLNKLDSLKGVTSENGKDLTLRAGKWT